MTDHIMTWIWQHPDWPCFTWQAAEIRKRSTNPICCGLSQTGRVSFQRQGSSVSRLSSSPSLGRVSNTNCRYS
ncbi:DUF4172 domain-containing protein [Halomonas sp.]|uniref:DUF4172 domain-containing protein n=1 Tax=Halomonas sp. TaxID=1486246 RepID=UPI00399FF3DF